MNLDITEKSNYTYVKILNKDLLINASTHLTSELVILNAKGQSNFILDLSDCDTCDTEGISAISDAHYLCKTSNGFLVVTGLQEEVEHKISLAQLDKQLHIAYRTQMAEKKMLSLLEE